LLLIGLAFAQDVRLSYTLHTSEEGTSLEVYAESYTESSVDLSALNVSVAHNAGCEVVGTAQSMLLESWTDYLAQATHAEELKLTHNDEAFSQRWQWGSADPGLPQTSVVTLAPAGTKTLILTQQFKGDCQDLYLEHVSENPLNELGDVDMQEMDYVIEHPQRTAKPQLDVSIAAFPNPTTDFVTLEATGLSAGTYTVRITDANGRLVQKQTKTFEAGDATTVTLDMRNEAAGVYIIDLVNEDNPAEAKAVRVMKD